MRRLKERREEMEVEKGKEEMEGETEERRGRKEGGRR